MNKFILLRYTAHQEWECVGMFDSHQYATMKRGLCLENDWEEALSWKWESYATIAGNKVMHSESKDVWSTYEIVKIKLPKMED
ncbi:uncharacterized protein METZ01_LOCUS503292 [marine metagenome]|uniref:Uncharacterized protein n=1 Tax=marine metagenome TaxID=408172 RepID=A0A383E2X6_9ZZZZ